MLSGENRPDSTATRAAFDGLAAYVDLDYMLWIRWLLSPLILTFVLPVLILLFIYLTALTLYVYRAHRKRLLRRLQQTVFEAGFWRLFFISYLDFAKSTSIISIAFEIINKI